MGGQGEAVRKKVSCITVMLLLSNNIYVDGNIRNPALPVMPRQYHKFFH